MKKKEETKKNSKADLTAELNEKRLKLRDIRFGIAGSKSKNVKEQKTIKKEIARILTSLQAMKNVAL
jgi:ribosomal protein L29